ncbi:PH domain-containing protein [Staphylococcus roterodami]|nr:PH domain-containing protein [Staphylococcus roterodami]UMT80132.1 PH domain-containing protein [Staphylococcus roterodami]
MRHYNFMSPYAKKVMRLSAILVWIPITLVLLIAFNILNWLFWQIIDTYLSIASSIIIILLVAIFTIVIVPFYRYKHCRYAFEERHLRVRNGILFLDEKVIPYFRIQNIDIDIGPIMKHYRLATLTLYTAGGPAKISLIDRSEARKLKKWLNNEMHLEKINEYNKNEE